MTKSTYELSLDEFRDAAAMVRRHFSALAEAREVQIIADNQHADISAKLAAAQARLDAADKALQIARKADDAPPHQPKIAGTYTVDPDGGIAPGPAGGVDSGQGDIALQSQPATIDAHANGLAIG